MRKQGLLQVKAIFTLKNQDWNSAKTHAWSLNSESHSTMPSTEYRQQKQDRNRQVASDLAYPLSDTAEERCPERN